ncbi:MAG: hypothetical protein ABJE95_00225 [Byssovorax sp.]
MIRFLWLLGASAALLACHPSSDSKARPTATASSSPVAAPVLGVAAAARKDPLARIVCGRHAPPQCRFQGRVREMRRAVLAPEEAAIDARDTLDQPLEIVLDDTAPLDCKTLQLRGVRQASGAAGSPDRRDGPTPWSEGEIPVAHALLISLRAGIHLPFAAGELVCGSVTAFNAGLGGRAIEALIARPSGDVLLADADSLPRDPAPLPGWTITFSPERSIHEPWRDYEMKVMHNGVSIQTTFNGPPAQIEAPDGEFLVESSGYTRMGPLGDEEAKSAGYLATKGYSFSLVRVEQQSPQDRSPGP